ncbi:MAG: gamma carbonic anhydrase family protein [Spirochaetales bacterium]|nr:gamma carbonic anhydrase family protein [Spirochaetales bacterium]
MIYRVMDKSPQIGEGVFIAPDASVMGDVVIGPETSIWFGCVVRGDVHHIRLGERCNIQDLSLLHVTGGRFPLLMEDCVSVGHRALLHGCTLRRWSFVGMGAIVMDDAELGEWAMLAAGSLLPPGKKIPPRMLAMGSPARVVREITEEEEAMFRRTIDRYVELKKNYLSPEFTVQTHA